MNIPTCIIHIIFAFVIGYSLPFIIHAIRDYRRSSRPYYRDYVSYKVYITTLHRYNVVKFSYDELRAMVDDTIHTNNKPIIDVDTYVTRNDGIHFYRWAIPGYIYNSTGFKVIDLSALSYNEFADLYKDMVPPDDPNMVKLTVKNLQRNR